MTEQVTFIVTDPTRHPALRDCVRGKRYAGCLLAAGTCYHVGEDAYDVDEEGLVFTDDKGAMVMYRPRLGGVAEITEV